VAKEIVPCLIDTWGI